MGLVRDVAWAVLGVGGIAVASLSVGIAAQIRAEGGEVAWPRVVLLAGSGIAVVAAAQAWLS